MAELNEIKNPKDIKGDKEEYNPKRKREIIKTVLIVFLAVLLVLTFFSNTIMNKSLAEISTEMTSSGKLTERIRGSGLVNSNQSYAVKVDGNQVVDTVNVKSGQQVKKGDVLLVVGTGENEEITSLQDNLEALELEYSKVLLTPPADYSTENQAIKNAREDLAEAIRKRDEAVNAQGNADSQKDSYKNNKSQLKKYTRLQTKLEAVIMAADNDEYSGAPAEYTGELVELKNQMTSAADEYASAKDIYMSLVSGGSSDEEDAPAPAVSESEITSARDEMTAKEKAYSEARSRYNSRKYEYRADWAVQLSDAENNIEYYTALIEEYESENSGGDMSVEQLEEAVKDRQRALEELINALDKTQKQENDQNKIENLERDAKKKEIDKLKKKIKELKKANEAKEITSKYSGVVSTVNVKAGDETIPDMELIVIDIAEEGYTVEITVDGKMSTKIKKGAEAEVVNNWSGGIQAILTEIKNDTTPNSKNRILVFTVTGDVDSGTYLDLSIPCGNGSYDSIVPKSAVYSDNDGSFVLTVQSKSSPLGNRYFARRVPVDVIVSDELSSAVTGEIGYGDYVITAASKPVKAGDQVRMKDN